MTALRGDGAKLTGDSACVRLERLRRLEWAGEVEAQEKRWVRSMLMGMLMLMLMYMLLLVLMLMLIGMLMRRLMLNLTLELMSKCVLMLMVMLMVMLSWVGGGGDGHFFFG